MPIQTEPTDQMQANKAREAGWGTPFVATPAQFHIFLNHELHCGASNGTVMKVAVYDLLMTLANGSMAAMSMAAQSPDGEVSFLVQHHGGADVIDVKRVGA